MNYPFNIVIVAYRKAKKHSRSCYIMNAALDNGVASRLYLQISTGSYILLLKQADLTQTSRKFAK